jgi:hypothetical protein
MGCPIMPLTKGSAILLVTLLSKPLRLRRASVQDFKGSLIGGFDAGTAQRKFALSGLKFTAAAFFCPSRHE